MWSGGKATHLRGYSRRRSSAGRRSRIASGARVLRRRAARRAKAREKYGGKRSQWDAAPAMYMRLHGRLRLGLRASFYPGVGGLFIGAAAACSGIQCPGCGVLTLLRCWLPRSLNQARHAARWHSRPECHFASLVYTRKSNIPGRTRDADRGKSPEPMWLWRRNLMQIVPGL